MLITCITAFENPQASCVPCLCKRKTIRLRLSTLNTADNFETRYVTGNVGLKKKAFRMSARLATLLKSLRLTSQTINKERGWHGMRANLSAQIWREKHVRGQGGHLFLHGNQEHLLLYFGFYWLFTAERLATLAPFEFAVRNEFLFLEICV